MSINIFALLYPFVSISFDAEKDTKISQILSETMPIFSLPEIVVMPQDVSTLKLIFFNLLPFIYVTGVILITGWILIQILSIMIQILRSHPETRSGIKVRISKQAVSPFSFFRWIVLSEDTKNETGIQEILLHEQTHVKQWHSIDVLFSELMCIFCWFNPFVWLMKREIRMNLEYLADRSVLKSGCDSEHYQLHLLRLSFHKTAANLSNNFNFSPLKKRIHMMNKKQTSRFGYTKHLLFIPVAAILLFLNNAGTVANASNDPATEKAVVATASRDFAIGEIQTFKIQSDSVYSHVEVMPQYPGGGKEMMKFLATNLKYPVEAQKNGIQGTVVARFIVTKEGKVDNAEIIRSLDPSCDEEALRIINLMPNWTPGKQSGKPVDVFFNLPIQFKLNSESKDKQPEKNSDVKADIIVVGYDPNN